MKRQALFALLYAGTTLLYCPLTAAARQTTISGSFSIREGFDSNIDRTSTNARSGWETILSPGIGISSRGDHDTLSLNYSPGFTFDHERNDHFVDHHLGLTGERRFSDTLRGTINESFIRSSSSFIEEPPAPGTAAARLLQENRQRERVSTNTVAVLLEKIFAADSNFTLGYRNDILRGETDRTDDYVRDNPSCSITYLFSPHWQGTGSFNYIKGRFKRADDLTTLQPSLQLNYRFSPITSVYGRYTFTDTDYQGLTRDYQIQDYTLGLDRSIDPQTTLGASAGYSTVDRGDITSNGFNFGLQARRTTSWGSWSLNGAGGLEGQQFSGTATSGLSRFWSLGADLTARLSEKITADLTASFRQDDFFEHAAGLDKTYSASGGLNFLYWRHITLACRYAYLKLDSEDPSRGYTDHRVYMQLSWSMEELWRW